MFRRAQPGNASATVTAAISLWSSIAALCGSDDARSGAGGPSAVPASTGPAAQPATGPSGRVVRVT